MSGVITDMKTIGIIILCIVGTFLLLALVGSTLPPRQLTSYQKCVETAEHLRSDAETKEWESVVCSRLPYEAGDYR